MTASTTYHYQVRSADRSGNLGTLADFTFTTDPKGPGIPITNGTWNQVLTKGLPEEANAWEQLVYVPPLKQSIMLSQYHQRGSELNETLVGYNFDTNSWDIVDMGGVFHTENMPEGGETQGYFDFNPNNNTLIYHCCTSGSNQEENANHTWWYDVVGQTGRDKQTPNEPPFMALQPGGAFDVAHNVFVMQGGASYVGTWTYDPAANRWQQVAAKGTPPDPSVILPGVAYSTKDQKVFLFGGEDGSAFYNDLYTYDVPTSTWTLISPAGGVKPPGRYRTNFAYDSTNNIFLLYGGQNNFGNLGLLGDTWVYDPVANTWTQLSPPQSPPATLADFSRLTYDSDHNVFVLAHLGPGGYFGGSWPAYCIQTWLFRYSGGGPNAGALSPTAQPAPGSINRNIESWGKDPVIAASGNALIVAWSETGSPFDNSDAAWPHIYADEFSSGAWIPLGSSFQSMSTDINEAHWPGLTALGSLPWASWHESADGGQTPEVVVKNWNGSSWQGGSIGYVGPSGQVNQGRSQLINIAGVPYIAFLEVNKTYYPQSVFAYVKTWNGTSWNLIGTGALNRSSGAGSTASSVQIAGDGTDPYVAWTEYVRTFTSAGDSATVPQLYVSRWNGSQWIALGGSLNITATDWATDASIAFLGGQPYVAWTERSQTGNAQLYVSTWNGTNWTLLGSGPLNQGGASGWAFHPSLVADPGSNRLYVGWIEQLAVGQKAQVYVAKYTGGSWQNLGGPLNIDGVNGSAQRVSLAVWNGGPVATWAEVNSGWLRQVYVAQWSGSTWTQLAGTGGPLDTTAPTAPTNLLTTTVSANQINLSWDGATDNVGIAGYYVYRNGSQIGSATLSATYRDTGLSPYTSYSYTVAAYDAAGNISSQSPVVGATTYATTPVGLAAVTLSPLSDVGGSSTTGNYVTLNGPAPSGGATVSLSSSNGIASVPGSVTVAAGATVSPTFTITTSSVATTTTVTIYATYSGTTKTGVLTVNSGTPTVAPPTFNPGPGTYNSAQTVMLSDSTAGATVHCTTDGSTPTPSSPVCTSVSVSTTTAINAIGTEAGYNNSSVASATYTINTTTSTATSPTMSPPPGLYNTNQTVTLADSTPGAAVHCTTDGSTPTVSSPVCTTVTVSATTVINAIAVASGYNNSLMASGTYSINAASPVSAYIVQSATGYVDYGTSVTVKFGQPTTVGNFLVVVVSDYNNPTSTQNKAPNTPTDSYNNTWQKDAAAAFTTGLTTIFSSKLNGAGPNHQVTVTKPTTSGAGSYYIVAAFEIAGLASSNWLDTQGNGVEQSSTTSYSSSISTSSSNDFVLGLHRSYSGTVILQPSSGWHLEANPSDNNVYHRLTVQSQAESATGTYNTSGTSPSAVKVDSLAIAYRTGR